jgi:uncharacterized integral membrane protein
VANGGKRDVDGDQQRQRRPISPELIGALVVAVVLVVFIIQNNQETTVEWLFFETTETPLWLVIFVSAVVGYALGKLIELAARRRRRRI